MNTRKADAYPVEGRPAYLGHAAELEAMFFWHWASLTDTVRTGQPIRWDFGSEEWEGESASEEGGP